MASYPINTKYFRNCLFMNIKFMDQFKNKIVENQYSKNIDKTTNIYNNKTQKEIVT